LTLTAVQYPFKSLTKESDAKAIEEFFKVISLMNYRCSQGPSWTLLQDKPEDVSKFNLALNQSLDTIRANAAVLNVSVTVNRMGMRC
jgi:hypothetical protein